MYVFWEAWEVCGSLASCWNLKSFESWRQQVDALSRGMRPVLLGAKKSSGKLIITERLHQHNNFPKFAAFIETARSLMWFSS